MLMSIVDVYLEPYEFNSTQSEYRHVYSSARSHEDRMLGVINDFNAIAVWDRFPNKI